MPTASPRTRAVKVLRLLDAAVPERQAAHGPRAQLHHQRHAHALPAHERLQRADAHGLGRLRPAGRERGAEERRAAGQVDLREHRLHARPAPGHGPGNRLEPRDRHLRSQLLQVEPVAVPQDARKGHCLPQDAGRQLGPGRPDRAGQRAGDRRQGLAHRRHGRAPRDPGLLPEDQRLRRRAARAHAAQAAGLASASS